MCIYSQSPEHQIHLLFPLRAKYGRVVSRCHKTQILEWYKIFEPNEEIGMEEMKAILVEECLTGRPSLQDTLKDYPEIVERAVEQEFGIELMKVHLFTEQNKPYIVI